MGTKEDWYRRYKDQAMSDNWPFPSPRMRRDIVNTLSFFGVTGNEIPAETRSMAAKYLSEKYGIDLSSVCDEMKDVDAAVRLCFERIDT